MAMAFRCDRDESGLIDDGLGGLLLSSSVRLFYRIVVGVFQTTQTQDVKWLSNLRPSRGGDDRWDWGLF
jgi:hypothetical protein